MTAPAGTEWIPGATFRMGSDEHYPEEAPAHSVAVDGFWMDAVAVTNARFAEFATATGYLTVAERPLDPADFPGAPACFAARAVRTSGRLCGHERARDVRSPHAPFATFCREERRSP